jgi:uncharacterized protein (TIGR00255 family)
MTGFAREAGRTGPWRWAWELKSVNAKGLDVRLRVPQVFEFLSDEVRGRLGTGVQRGTCFVNLSATREETAPIARLNTQLLDALVEALAPYDGRMGLRAPSVGSLLAVRGVVEVGEAQDEPERAAEAGPDLIKGFDVAVSALVSARRREGAALGSILAARLDRIEALADAADASPARRPEAIKARLAEQVAALFEASQQLDPVRLHQEAVLLATKADIREEIDRLRTHVGAARELLGQGGPVGRRLDFLAQEFSREANTLCAKANDVSLTVIGLDLKTEVEQFREQVQNVE